VITCRYVLCTHNIFIFVRIAVWEKLKMIYIAAHRRGPLPESAMPERDFRDILRLRLGLLVGEDRALMTLHLDSGHSFQQLSRLTGASPTTVARKIRRIARRLADETYPLCLRNKSEFSVLELHIVRDHFVRGLSCGRIRRNRNLSYYRVRTTVLKARRYAASSASLCT